MLRPLISPNNTIAAYPNGNALVITDYADNLKRLDRIIASLDQPPGGEPVLVPLRYASAIDIVPLINKLVADTVAAGIAGTPPDVQQRVTVIADPRSNAILLRADNPGRVARLRQLIEQLDTPGRPGGNMFIVYLRNADAARVAQTLRAMLTGSSEGRRPSRGHRSFAAAADRNARQCAAGRGGAHAAAAAAAPFTSSSAIDVRCRRRDDHRRHCEQCARDHGARADLQQSARDHREARHAPGASVRRGADLRSVRRQGGRIRHPVAGAQSGYNSTQTRVIGGTNFTPRGSPGNNIIDVAANPGIGRAGPRTSA